ncbi:uncharacterized protein EI90DRAFT_3016158 [Cantharellus anzutake]|uniref:uncharacterized protein n=1 Tax=Cantharellus anzutake TaxID=1750568 RepID=UPI0019039F69|nr:uncharacterized protein EI90DRAFT_3016158 [Cantharellus anzutake]KAF8332062.1 hypothetical protein EI90DRAFT_3016158 [Cantharellus anzutake]
MSSTRDATKGSIGRTNDCRASTNVVSPVSGPVVMPSHSSTSRATTPRIKRVFTRKDSIGFGSSLPFYKPAPSIDGAQATSTVPKLPPKQSSPECNRTIRGTTPLDAGVPGSVTLSSRTSTTSEPHEKSPRRPTLLNIFQHSNPEPRSPHPSKSKDSIPASPPPKPFGLLSKKNKTAIPSVFQDPDPSAESQLNMSSLKTKAGENKVIVTDKEGKGLSSGFQFPRPRLGSSAKLRNISPPPPLGQQVRGGSSVFDSAPSTPSSPKKTISTFAGLKLKKSRSSLGVPKRRSMSLGDMTQFVSEVGVMATDEAQDVSTLSSKGSRPSQDKFFGREPSSSSDLNLQGTSVGWSGYSMSPTTPTKSSTGVPSSPSPSSFGKKKSSAFPPPPRHPTTSTSAPRGVSPPRPGHQHQFSASAKMHELGRKGWDKMERLLGGREMLSRSHNGSEGGSSISPGNKFYKTQGASPSESTTLSGGGDSVTIMASSMSSSGPKLPLPLRPARSEGGGLLFGRPLASAVADTLIGAYSDDDRWLDLKGKQRGLACPALVVRCIQHLELWGIEEEGLFRITGRSTHANRLRNEFDAGADYDLRNAAPGDLDPHSVSSVFKAYFRELPEPILTRSLARSFDDALMGSSKTASSTPSSMRDATADMIFELQSLMTKLPPENFSVLRELCRLLKKTSDYQAVNKMPLSNLILIFCPSLNMNPSLLRVLVEVQEDIFSPSPPSRTTTTSKSSKRSRLNDFRQPSASDLKLANAMSSPLALNQTPIVTPIIHRMPSIPKLSNSSSRSQLRSKHSHNISLPIPSISQPSTTAENVLTFPGLTASEGAPQRSRTGSVRALGNLFIPRSRSNTLRSPDSESGRSNSRLSSFLSTNASTNGDETDELPKASDNPRRRSDTAPHISLHISTGGLLISPSSSPTTSHRASWSEPVLPLPPTVDHSTAQANVIVADAAGSRTPIADLFRVDTAAYGRSFKSTTVVSSGSGNSAAASSSSSFTKDTWKSVGKSAGAPIAAHATLDKKAIDHGSVGGTVQNPNSTGNVSGNPTIGVVPASSSPNLHAPRLSVQRGAKSPQNEDWATSVLIAARVEPTNDSCLPVLTSTKATGVAGS